MAVFQVFFLVVVGFGTIIAAADNIGNDVSKNPTTTPNDNKTEASKTTPTESTTSPATTAMPTTPTSTAMPTTTVKPVPAISITTRFTGEGINVTEVVHTFNNVTESKVKEWAECMKKTISVAGTCMEQRNNGTVPKSNCFSMKNIFQESNSTCYDLIGFSSGGTDGNSNSTDGKSSGTHIGRGTIISFPTLVLLLSRLNTAS